MGIIIILLFLLISSIQLNRLRKKKLLKEAVVYFILMLVAFVYSLSIIYNFKLPTISKITTYVFQPVADIIGDDKEE